MARGGRNQQEGVSGKVVTVQSLGSIFNLSLLGFLFLGPSIVPARLTGLSIVGSICTRH